MPRILFPELLVYGLLLLLGGLSLGLAFAPLGQPTHILVALAIAVVMIGLVLTFFMDLNRATAIILLAAASGVIFLMVLFVLTMSDYLTRNVAPDEPPSVGDASAVSLRTSLSR
nr:cytochrome C oxidase subunit IV family protein [Aurantimonas sp. VKM B-3413]